MKEAVRNLIFLSVLLFSISYDSFVTGVNYDKKYKLHSETYDYGGYSCWFSKPHYEYGNRWKRLGQTSLAIGLVIVFSTFVVAAREEKTIKTFSILNEKS